MYGAKKREGLYAQDFFENINKNNCIRPTAYFHPANKFMELIKLRRWQAEDTLSLSLMANNKKIWDNVRDRLPHPYTLEDARNWIVSTQKENPVLNFCVEYDGWVAGSAGILLQDDIYRKSAEVGYFIAEPYWGKGIATKALSILMGYIQDNFDLVRICAITFSHNEASIKVLQKNNFYLESIRRKAAIKNDQLIDDMVWVKWLK